jgi:AAA family ATP:ADP antiporter
VTTSHSWTAQRGVSRESNSPGIQAAFHLHGNEQGIGLSVRTNLDRGLSIFASVEDGEGLTALLLMMDLFLVMTAYYIIKPVRESLILGGAGPEMKSYAGAASALVFLLIVPLYGRVASRLNRLRLINGVTAFFASNLVVFYVLGRLNVRFGFAFFLWVGLFNLMLVAQFWAFTNDIYTPERGARLFAIIGMGSSLGAIFGARAASWLFMTVGTYPMLLVAAALLTVCMVLTRWVHDRESHGVVVCQAREPLKSDGGFQLIFKHRYLLLIALLIVLSNLVNATGEFILGKSVSEQAMAAATGAPDAAVARQEYIGKFYADFYFWVNIVGALLQMFAVSRVMKYAGIGPSLFFLPMIALGGYTLLSFAPMLTFIRATKIAENGTDYSIQNTARHALFLRTSREAKYKGKTAIDSFFWRTGDALSALIVFVGTSLAFDLRSFARTNAILTAAWMCVAVSIVWLRVSEGAPELEESNSVLDEPSDAGS